MRKIKALTFDLEGTAIDLENLHHQAHILAAKDAGIHITIADALERIPSFIGGPDEKIAEELCGLSGSISSDCVLYIIQRDEFYYKRALQAAKVNLRTGFATIVEQALQIGLKVAIGTLTCRADAELLIERTGLEELVEAIVVREDVKYPKPLPDVFLETARRLSVSPSEQIVFEDSPNGIRSAQTAGSIPVAIPIYRTASLTSRLISEGAKRIFFDWRDVNLIGLVESLSEEAAD